MNGEFAQSDATLFGNKIHEFFDNYIKNDKVDSYYIIDGKINTFDLPCDFEDIAPLVHYIDNLKIEAKQKPIFSDTGVKSEVHLQYDNMYCNPDKLHFNGFIDVLTYDEVCDFKTINSKTLSSYDPAKSEQLKLYAYYANLMLHTKVDKITYLIYCKDTKKCEIRSSLVTPDELEKTADNFQKKRIASQFIQEKNLDFRSKNEYCFFCEFRKECDQI